MPPPRVAFVWELTKETTHLPQGCLQGGSLGRRRGEQTREIGRGVPAELDLHGQLDLPVVVLPEPAATTPAPPDQERLCWEESQQPPWRQPRGKSMVSFVNSYINSTRIGWHLLEIDLRFAPGSPPEWARCQLDGGTASIHRHHTQCLQEYLAHKNPPRVGSYSSPTPRYLWWS